MSLAVSPQMRIVLAVVGALVVLAGGAYALGIGKPGSAPAPVSHLVRHPHRGHGLHSLTVPGLHRVVHVVRHPRAGAAAHPAAVTVPAAQPAPVQLVPGLPSSIAAALRRHDVVVVSLYDPRAEIDGISLGEARAGAALAGAGFVALSVLDESQTAPLVKVEGVLQDPELLVFTRPGQVVVHLTGFADRETVAQAASSLPPSTLAAGGGIITTPAHAAHRILGSQSWLLRANTACARVHALGSRSTSPTGEALLVAASERQDAALARISVPALKAGPYAAFVSAEAHTLALVKARLGAGGVGQAAATGGREERLWRARANARAVALGLTNCVTPA